MCVQAFDDLLLMKVGGHIIYHGPLGTKSVKLVEYFEVRPADFFRLDPTGKIKQRSRCNGKAHARGVYNFLAQLVHLSCQ